MIDERQLAILWYERVFEIQHGHYLAALHFTRRHWRLGSITVAITAIVGTSVFVTATKVADLLVITGALSIIATLLASLQTFLSYGERADKHRVSGARYGIVGRKLELLLARPEFAPKQLEEIKENLDALAQECPHIPEVVFKKMKSKGNPLGLRFEENEAPQGT